MSFWRRVPYPAARNKILRLGSFGIVPGGSCAPLVSRSFYMGCRSDVASCIICDQDLTKAKLGRNASDFFEGAPHIDLNS